MHPAPSQQHRSTVQFELDVPDKFKTELPTSKVQNGNSSTYSLSGFLLFNLKSVPLFAPTSQKWRGTCPPDYMVPAPMYANTAARRKTSNRVPKWRVRVQVRVLNLQVRVQVRVTN